MSKIKWKVTIEEFFFVFLRCTCQLVGIIFFDWTWASKYIVIYSKYIYVNLINHIWKTCHRILIKTLTMLLQLHPLLRHLKVIISRGEAAYVLYIIAISQKYHISWFASQNLYQSVSGVWLRLWNILNFSRVEMYLYPLYIDIHSL